METSSAVAALAALAQDNRLDVFRLLVQAGPQGLAAGEVAAALGLAPNTLTFHFDRLRVLLESPDLRAEIAARGRLRARAFQWETCAAKSLEFFQQAAG